MVTPNAFLEVIFFIAAEQTNDCLCRVVVLTRFLSDFFSSRATVVLSVAPVIWGSAALLAFLAREGTKLLVYFLLFMYIYSLH